MLAEISSEQLSEWMAYSKLEPWGEDRDDLRMGIVASVIANSNRGKGQKPFKPTDFMPSFEPVDPEEQTARLLAKAMAALGGKR
jgi:hypothetical protein